MTDTAHPSTKERGDDAPAVERMRPGDPHYRAYVGPPEQYDQIAASQFCLLVRLGLKQSHKLLDIGCGSLRAGRLLIPYLNPGNYYGVEPEAWLVEEGIKHELGQDLIDLRKPSFLFVSDWSFDRFDVAFDYLIAQSIFSHAAPGQIHQCLRNAERCMRENSIMAATFCLGREDYTGRDWVYPGLVTYRPRTISRMVEEAGLVCLRINWYHPIQTWYLIGKPESEFHLKESRRGLRRFNDQRRGPLGTAVRALRRIERKIRNYLAPA